MMLHQMRKEGKSIRRISRETGLSRNTVKSYLKAKAIPERKARKEGFKTGALPERDSEMMKLGIFNCEVIYPRLKSSVTRRKTTVKD